MSNSGLSDVNTGLQNTYFSAHPVGVPIPGADDDEDPGGGGGGSGGGDGRGGGEDTGSGSGNGENEGGAGAGQDLFFEDDEQLGALEKIYLYARSRAVFHR